MSTLWHCRIGESERGPITTQELKQLARDGQLQPTDLIRRSTDDRWYPAHRAGGLTFQPTPVQGPPVILPPPMPRPPVQDRSHPVAPPPIPATPPPARLQSEPFWKVAIDGLQHVAVLLQPFFSRTWSRATAEVATVMDNSNAEGTRRTPFWKVAIGALKRLLAPIQPFVRRIWGRTNAIVRNFVADMPQIAKACRARRVLIISTCGCIGVATLVLILAGPFFRTTDASDPATDSLASGMTPIGRKWVGERLSSDQLNKDMRQPSPLITDAITAFDRVVAIRGEQDRLPAIVTFNVVGQLEANTYEIVSGGSRAILRTFFTQFESTGQATMPLQPAGTKLVKTKSGFQQEFPVFNEALSDAGALALSAEEVRGRQVDFERQAAAARREVVVALLIAKNADTSVDALAHTLHVKLDGRKTDDLSGILQELTSTTARGYGPIEYAVQVGNIDLMRSLLLRKKEFSNHEHLKQPLIHVVVTELGRSGITLTSFLDLLLSQGSLIDERDSDGRTVLHLAVEQHNVDLLRILFQRGASIDAADRDGSTPLHLAIKQEGDSTAATVLIDLGANANAHDAKGRSPLHIACQRDTEELVALLLSHGASIDGIDVAGQTALHVACHNNNSRVVKVLLAHGANREIKDYAGQTPVRLLKNNSALQAQMVVTASLLLGDGLVLARADGTMLVAGRGSQNIFSFAGISPDGKLKWRHNIYGERADSGCLGPDGMAFINVVPDSSKTPRAVTEFDVDGKKQWQLVVNDMLKTSIAADQVGNAYFVALDASSFSDMLWAVDNRGAVKWRFSLRTVSLASCLGKGFVVEPDGTSFVGGMDVSSNEGLFAVTSSGKQMWFFSPLTNNTRLTAISSRVGKDGTIYAAFTQGGDSTLYAITRGGRKLWEKMINGDVTCSPSVGGDGTIYVCADNLTALSSEGGELWKQRVKPVVAPVFDPDGSIYAVDLFGCIVRLTSKGMVVGRLDLFYGTTPVGLSLSSDHILRLIRHDGTVELIDTRLW